VNPFFTKWLWAASGTGAPAAKCLVLDSWVWKSLNDSLGWNSVEAAGTQARSDRYAAYVAGAHRWARALSIDSSPVSGEDVECVLFTADGNLNQL
jgi:hypothetical protein